MPPYTKEERAELTAILEKQLGPEYVSKRPSGGGSVSYIEGWKAFNLANHVFGFDGWNSEIKSTTVDYLDDHGGNGKFSLGLSVVVRVTLKDGTFHEDLGYGSVENARSKAMAFEKCKKQAITDGMKRCLRCFGNVLGNCLYDKDFLKFLAKTSMDPPVFSESDLFRQPVGIAHENNLAEQKKSTKQVSFDKNISANATTAAQQQEKEDLSVSMFDDSMDEAFDEFNDLDDYDMELIKKSEAADTEITETADSSAAVVPANVAFVKATMATEIQANPASISQEKVYKAGNLNGIKRSSDIDHSRSTPVKRR